ncbi:MAG: hypothetical protein J0H44_06445 [Alphaproteobacteria bacterium]|nr:hypothetical protein [Alphaproteobacteria bacterium]
MLVAVCCGLSASQAAASDATCVTDFFNGRPKDAPLDPTAADAEGMIRQVAASFNLVGSIVIIPCKLVSKAEAYVAVPCNVCAPGENDDKLAGEYILYDPDWFREVAGRERMQKYWIFGHELAHILNRDFIQRQNESQLDKEKRADFWAGCAVARMKGDIKSLDEIVYKLRREKDDSDGYPDRETSLQLTRSGYQSCSPEPAKPEPVTVTYKVCSGEYENRCQTHDVYLYCHGDVGAWAKPRCTSYKVQRLNSYGGNKCGYSIDAVICTGPK